MPLAGFLLMAGIALGTTDKPSFHGPHSGPKIDNEALFASAVPLNESAEGREVLAGCLEAYGGVEKLKELQGFRLRYSMTSMMGAATLPVDKSFRTGRGYRYTKGDRERILDGQECWYIKEGEVVAMDGGRYCAELFSHLTLAMPLAAETERFDAVRFGKRDGDDLSYLYFDKADSVLVVLGIEPDTGMIRTSTGVVRHAEKRFVFVNEFDDFRQVEGFWFPHALVNISMGLKVATSVLEKVEINPAFGQDDFQPPKNPKNPKN